MYEIIYLNRNYSSKVFVFLYNMKKILIFLFALHAHLLQAQILSNDTVACNLYQDTLYALGSDISDMQADDLHDTVVTIGFPFTFYGIMYIEITV